MFACERTILQTVTKNLKSLCISRTIGAVIFWVVIAVHPGVADDPSDFSDMSLEALVDIEITSVSKKTEKLSAVAVFVISNEVILRSGATNLAEVLRMAPGVHVAKFDAAKYAVTIRWFNGRFANKLLALIDGRSIYTLLFSSVFWETQDLVLADIDRAGFKAEQKTDAGSHFTLSGHYFDQKMGETVAEAELSFTGPPYATVSYPHSDQTCKGGISS